MTPCRPAKNNFILCPGTLNANYVANFVFANDGNVLYLILR